MEALQRFLRTRAGIVLLVVLIVGCSAYGVYAFKRMFGPSEGAAAASDRLFVCSETLKSYRVTIGLNTAIPAYSPYSAKNTGYPAELCYWEKDGSVLKEPTGVLLNERIGKSGPTFCPYCGRLVVGHNPPAAPGAHPPPTRTEYMAKNNG